MRRTIKTLIIQKLWGKVMLNHMIDDIIDLLCDLPMNADRKQIKTYLKNKQDEKSN